jgi:TRAP-type mannitol/chloroaromatic compound transport system substrate-binding protein
MQRRQALQKIAALGAATVSGAAIAAPAVITQPSIQWRLASSFPKSLDTIYGAAEMLSKRVAQLTDGKFQIRVFASGDLVPGLQVLDAVSNGTVECGHTAGYYYVGKSKAFAFDTCLPFGLTARQQNAWYSQAGGQQLLASYLNNIILSILQAVIQARKWAVGLENPSIALKIYKA